MVYIKIFEDMIPTEIDIQKITKYVKMRITSILPFLNVFNIDRTVRIIIDQFRKKIENY